MKLHENQNTFVEMILSASQSLQDGGVGVSAMFVEKDYWICRSLALMLKGDKAERAVFKGGTSLTKAYNIGTRFSEDIDIAIAGAWELSGNQLKNLIRSISKNMTAGLEEIVIPGRTSKGSHYHKAFYKYPCIVEPEMSSSVSVGRLLIEINSFANPYPTEKRIVKSFITEFLERSGNTATIEEYDMQPFEIMVLDKRRTLTEKLVSLFRQSLATENFIAEIVAKIRHFYDLYYLYQDEEIKAYLESEAFKQDFLSLYRHDQEAFDKPAGWKGKEPADSPLLSDFHSVWASLQSAYLREMPALAYRPIPEVDKIEQSVVAVLNYLRK